MTNKLVRQEVMAISVMNAVTLKSTDGLPISDSGIDNSIPVVTAAGLPVVRRGLVGTTPLTPSCYCCQCHLKVNDVIEIAV